MECKQNNILENCLFFTANSLARIISKMGEEEFSSAGMTPSYAFLLTIVINSPGVSQKELSYHLHMAPSTVSRFVDSLLAKGLLTKRAEGRSSFIYPTEAGLEKKPQIEEAWKRLHERYSRLLGKEHGDMLAKMTAEASRILHNEQMMD